MKTFKEYLYEISKVQSFSLRSTSWISKTDKNLKPLPGGSGLFWLTRKTAGKLVIYIYTDAGKDKDTGPDELIEAGFLELSNEYPGAYPIPVKVAKLIHVAPEFRGRGIAKSLYGIAMSILGFNIAADDLQTAGGRRNWQQLYKIPGVKIHGFVRIHKDLYDEKIAQQIMNAGGVPLASKGYNDFYEMPVAPDKLELKFDVKRQFKLYQERGTGDMYTPATGMYAVWSGK